MSAFPLSKGKIRLAMLGMVDGNGHPYSWSAIINGYNREEMAKCPYAGIPQYLFREPAEAFGFEDVAVTHVWTDDPADAEKVSRASLVPNILKRPEDAIGQVDAVVVATDKGHEHVERCRPFVEAGLPIFVDKPMTDNLEDLAVFRGWIEGGAKILSSSCMRYAKEFMPYRISTHELGTLHYACITMAKTWERYGIHAMECIYPILGPGFLTVQNTGTLQHNMLHLTHKSGAEANVTVIDTLYGGFGHMLLAGSEGSVAVKMNDTFYAFRTQLKAFVDYLRTGQLPFPFAETDELMKIIAAGTLSRDRGGEKITLASL